MTGLLQVGVRFCLELESFFTSVERVYEYIDTCPQEESDDKYRRTTSNNWLEKGEIKYVLATFIVDVSFYQNM